MTGVFVDQNPVIGEGFECNVTSNGQYTGCGVGNNPCITLYTCGLDTGVPCIDDNYDVLSAVRIFVLKWLYLLILGISAHLCVSRFSARDATERTSTRLRHCRMGVSAQTSNR